MIASTVRRAGLLAVLVALPSLCFAQAPQVDGIDRFRQVSDRLYRGAQPDDAAYPELAKLGVKTVLDLRRRGEHSVEAESLAVTAAGMRYVNFPMNGFDTPTAAQMTKVLAVIDGSERTFVHCKQGRDRTGSVVAAYRVAREGWTNSRALAEANEHGMHWFESGMRRFIGGYRPASDEPAATAPVASAVGATDSTQAVPAARPAASGAGQR